MTIPQAIVKISLHLGLALLSLGPVNAQDLTPPLPQERPMAEPSAQEEIAREPANDGEDASIPQDRIYQSACPAMLSGRIEAEALESIEDGVCGIRSPLAVSAVMLDGHRVELTGTPVLNCRMATELADWAEALDAYARAAHDSGLAQILAGTAYQCRPRNNQPGGLFSEHAFGNALDVAGVLLEDGSRMDLLENWTPAEDPPGRFLRHAHATACGQFTTVLGPDANDLHDDHLHLDLGCHGQSCTAQICE